MKNINAILEVEIGVVGGEEDGVEAEINDKLYTSSEDFEKTVDALGIGEQGKYLLAATFGNVHGVYKPGNVKLKPEVLEEGQKVAAAKLGLAAGSQPFDFVFHGGSGSLKSEIEDYSPSSPAKAARSAAVAKMMSLSMAKDANGFPAAVAPAISSPTSRTIRAARVTSQRAES